MVERMMGLLLVGFMAAGAQAIEPISVAQVGGPTVAALVNNILDENSPLTIVGTVTAANNTKIAGSTALTNSKALAEFTHGNTTAAGAAIVGTLLPAANQNVGGNASYVGGLGSGTIMENGICLSTGFSSQAVAPSPPAGRGHAVEGPNNGLPVSSGNAGEVSSTFVFSDRSIDEELTSAIYPDGVPGELAQWYGIGQADAAVLEFTVNMTTPGYIRLSFVYASDEFDAYIEQPYNDAIAIFVYKENGSIEGTNIATFRHGIDDDRPFTLHDLVACDEPFFKKNQIAPSPAVLQASDHKIGGYGEIYFNHEFGGFSKVLTRESRPLAPGNYTIKFVIADINDFHVDSSLFIQKDSLKVFTLAQGDYNGDGSVNAADYTTWRTNYLNPPANPSFRNGDGNGDGLVNNLDYQIWIAHYGNTGNKDLAADFDRDGCVGGGDLGIFSFWYNSLSQCASRFEGDADGDGDVDAGDLGVLSGQYGMGNCGGGNLMAGGEGEQQLAALLATEGLELESGLLDQLEDSIQAAVDQVEPALAPLAKHLLPSNPDMDDDGDVDQADIAALDAIILGK